MKPKILKCFLCNKLLRPRTFKALFKQPLVPPVNYVAINFVTEDGDTLAYMTFCRSDWRTATNEDTREVFATMVSSKVQALMNQYNEDNG